jgi:hypothetical protein
MMKFKILMNGERKEYPARRFSHYVDGVRFWFAIHDPVDYTSGLTVSHWDSGKRLLHIGPTVLAASYNMKPAEIGRAEINKLVGRVGAIKVAQVLRAAEAEA